MDARPGLQGRQFSLVLKLYLLLAAIFLPSFALYYVYQRRVVRALYEEAVDGVTLRLQELLGSYDLPTLAQPPAFPTEEEKATREAQRSEVQHRLQGLQAAVPGVDGISVFAIGRGTNPCLLFLGGCGTFSTRTSMEDVDAYQHHRVTRSAPPGEERRALAVSAPIRRWNERAGQEETIGAVHALLSPSRMGIVGLDSETVLLGWGAGMMLLVGLGLAFFFHHAVRKPSLELIDAMKRAAEGNLSALVDPRTGEMGRLASSYNQMMRRLKQSMDENEKLLARVQGFNEELTRKVEGATRELAGKNKELGEANEKLFLLQRQMTTQEKLATLGQLATTIAHDLGTPLNAISGHLQLLAEEEVGEKARERLKVIDAQVDRLIGIVRNVLRTMRVPPPRLEPMKVNPVIEDVLALVAPVVRKRSITVELRLMPDLPTVPGDADQMEQVLLNLLTNAMDAMSGGGALRVATSFLPAAEAARLSVESTHPLPEGSLVRIDVSDSGVGMDEETARRAFEPFFSTKSGTDEESGGVGLGLAICRQIMKGHQGEVTVRSEPGKGTTFSLFLPVARDRVLV